MKCADVCEMRTIISSISSRAFNFYYNLYFDDFVSLLRPPYHYILYLTAELEQTNYKFSLNCCLSTTHDAV